MYRATAPLLVSLLCAHGYSLQHSRSIQRSCVKRKTCSMLLSKNTLTTARCMHTRSKSNMYGSLDDDEETNLSTKGSSTPNLTQPYFILGLLLLAFTSNQLARQIIFYLCNFGPDASAVFHMNIALQFSQEEYATAASIGFTLFFAVSSVFAGSIIDTVNRRNTIALSCAAWSAISLLEAQATDFNSLLILRVFLAISQSFFNPAAFTLISDIFPKQFIGTANGVLSGGVYLGGGLASLCILLDQQVGWRNTLNAIGVVGLFLAIAIQLTVREPSKAHLPTPASESTIRSSSGSTPSSQSSSSPLNLGDLASKTSEYGTAIRDVFSSPGARILLIASALRFAAGFTIGVWKAPFVFEKFPGADSMFASSNALIVAGGGLASSLLGGYLSDLLAQRSKSDSSVRLWVPAIGSLLAAPLWLGFIYSDSPQTSAAFLLAEYLAAECWVGPTLAGLYSAVPEKRRGTAQGVFSFLTAVGNFSPLLVGALVDGKLLGVHVSIGDSIAVLVVAAYLLSGAMFAYFALSKPVLADVEDVKSV